ncbi:MAG: hypothetical protein COT92_00320 [Candidatus Doudnabacteria bacterium CG10_big_fil_rev_8_21_14_0_10_42_18]|uniref:Uncharacterized protein n=1 Tax=Candidatus Doudnabacteria bacterium CG10_big_fil_rev_8_21_14_0_10_42_18 TaxID=1974552 RepID=A0A2H0VBV8_9BACT|nr:MAG: hypothetical protein COT92_00320 [Candidatus Doudnabacteria bacterium CG10_big_fil_rev_8_21_14_0_10_42_18]
MNQEKLIKKINKLKKEGGVDLSTEEDLSLAVMNLVSLEEHFFFTGEKTGKGEYFELLNQTREIRKELLARMMPQNEGETWCISKHLLAATMRLMEVGTKLLKDKKEQQAKEMFDKAYKLYNFFWALRLKLINARDLKKIGDSQLNKHDGGEKPWTKEDIVSKLVDCCDE